MTGDGDTKNRVRIINGDAKEKENFLAEIVFSLMYVVFFFK